MYPIAILSDVNANLEALDAVLSDVERQGIHQLIFLGDALGHGPSPIECISKLRDRAAIYLRGRLESLAVSDNFDRMTRNESLHHASTKLRTTQYFEWLKERPLLYNVPTVMAVHANPRGPEYEGILMEDIQGNETRLKPILSCFERLLFIGDNHRPWIYSRSTGGITDKQASAGVSIPPNEKVIVSVGSVGQPRDRDPRACYLVATDGHINWRRIEYDVQTTVSKINELSYSSDYANYLVERLLQGI